MTAPERIWVGDERPVGGTIHVWNELAENARRYATEYTRADLVPDPAALVRAALEAAAMKPLWIADMLRKNSMTAINVDLHNAARDIRAIATDPAAVAEIVERAKGAGE